MAIAAAMERALAVRLLRQQALELRFAGKAFVGPWWRRWWFMAFNSALVSRELGRVSALAEAAKAIEAGEHWHNLPEVLQHYDETHGNLRA